MPENLPLVVNVTVLAWAYHRGFGRLRRAEADATTSRGQAACFFAGLAVGLAVLATPFEHLASQRLWAHMVQHVALVAVAAPLVVLGNPTATLLAALPDRARLAPVVRRRLHGPDRHYAAWAAVAFGIHTAALWAWHVPGLYEAALRSELLHVVEHATLLGSAVLFWWVVVGSRRRALYGAGVLVTFAAALQGSALGALMTLASTPWYPSYVTPVGPGARTGLSPLEDQQVAGVVMWGPCALIYALAAILLFTAWIRPAEPDVLAPVEAGSAPDSRLGFQ